MLCPKLLIFVSLFPLSLWNLGVPQRVGVLTSRPSLSKKVFPVRRVTPKKASREVGIFSFFCFPFFIDYDVLRRLRKKNFFSKIMKKKFHPALFSPPGRWTGNHFLFKGGPRLPPVLKEALLELL